MTEWKGYITKKNVVLAIPWFYLTLYLFAWYGLSRLYADVMNGKAIIDPYYNTMELTMMICYWVTTAFMICGYVLIRYACRLSVGITAAQRISALERRIEELESGNHN